MKMLRHFRWYVAAFFKKHGKLVLLSMVIGVLVFVLLPSLITSIPFLKPTLYVGRVGSYSLAQLPRDIQEKISFGLTQSSENGEVIPALASTYSREENGKSYRFTIKPHVFWQDGREVMPQDISYSFSDAQVARTQNDILFRITAKKQDENAQEPVLPVSFLSLVSQPLFRTEKIGGLFHTQLSVIGLGVYRITSLVNQGIGIKEMALESDRDRIVYRFYATEHDAIVAFKRGEVDQVEGLQDTEDLKNWKNTTVKKIVHWNQYVGVFFNLDFKDENGGQPFANKQLRQALNYAIRKPDSTNRIFSPIDKFSWAYVKNSDDINQFNQNMDQAMALFAKVELQQRLTIDLLTTPTYASLAESVKRDWEQLGTRSLQACMAQPGVSPTQCEARQIAVNVRITNFPDITNYEAMLVGQQVPNDPDQYTLWDSTQQTNITHYKNARVDKLLEDGRRTDNREDRKLIYQEFQQILVGDSPVVFLEPISTFTVTRTIRIL